MALPSVRYEAGNAYRTAVNRHLIPNLGAHRVDKIEPEHFEKLYAKMLKSGLKSATAHQVHRTARTAFGEALRRGAHHRQSGGAGEAAPRRRKGDRAVRRERDRPAAGDRALAAEWRPVRARPRAWHAAGRNDRAEMVPARPGIPGVADRQAVAAPDVATRV
ncbi:hypothetical protein Q5425_18955 [Amycolatopsis sp. A133]|uniref:hypothetical protein n=1 Tax=Amycolatopsis sp. A133 TaxID=3064472 RepID=UPI0027FCD23A|nr:hypothetical protein [Amycolatopsis sp. A133]MDQ7805830.1 hypothetical protein [Amycolatopsis sp. A133]